MGVTSAAIEDHAIVGDCRSAALVTRDGSVDWLCWPRFDSAPLFGALLDPERGGSWRIAPRSPLRAERRYVPDTNVLVTSFETPSGAVEITDLMPVTPASDARTELVPEHELLRGVTCLRGEVDMELFFDPRAGYGGREVRLRPSDTGCRGELAHGVIILRSDADARLEPDGTALRAAFRLREGDRSWWSLTYAHDGPAVLPALGDAAVGRVDRTARWWRSWCARMSYGGRHAEAVRRSALVLRLLFYSPSGAVVAAPTTSLPERIGGESNWDYRYCWLRDAALTVRALAGLGYREEAEAFVSWLLHSTRLTRPEVRPLYTVFGGVPGDEREIESLDGYRGSRPVRVGNLAAEQLQLDVYGELVEAVTLLLRGRERLDRETRSMLTEAGEFVCRNWRRADAGIWEERGSGHEHTLSRALCWIALERIIELQDRGLLPRSHRDLFERTRQELRQAVTREGWSDEGQSYVERSGDPAIDASLLLVGWYGFEDPASPRMRSTVDRIRERLGAGRGLLYRRRDEAWPREGAFLVCSFWLVELLARGGRRDEVDALFDELLGHANDVGLYAEELDPETGGALGNFPQGLTHLGLVNAALTLAEGPS